jgi:hypothetical protein
MSAQIPDKDSQFYRYSPGEILILGRTEKGFLVPNRNTQWDYYEATTYTYKFDSDTGEAVRIEGYGPFPAAHVCVPTPCLVMLLRYVYYRHYGWTARISFSGIECNVTLNMLLPLNTPREFGWKAFETVHQRFITSKWPFGLCV